MLMMIGAVPVEIWPVNATDYSLSDKARFAEKSVLGRRPILEAQGEGEGGMTITCRLFPEKFGGLEAVDILQAQRAAQQAIPVLRGDGKPLGWMVITDINVRHDKLDAQGVGKIVTAELTLKKSDPPGASAMLSLLSSLFS